MGREPGFAVELACCRRSEISGGDVNHAVWEFERVEEFAFETEQLLVFSQSIFLPAVGEHLDFVEPVHPEDAAGVLAVGAGLPSEAGGEAAVAQGQRVGIEEVAAVAEEIAVSPYQFAAVTTTLTVLLVT